MREYFTYGSVRGAAGDGGPYRDRQTAHSCRHRPLLGAFLKLPALPVVIDWLPTITSNEPRCAR